MLNQQPVFKKGEMMTCPYPRRTIKDGFYFNYFSAISGGLFGIIIGWHLYYGRKTLPDGRSVYNYGEWERIHGKLILLLGSILLPVWIMIKLRHPSEN